MNFPIARTSLSDWIWIYSATILFIHLIANIIILWFWPKGWPLDVWSLVAGISTSGIVALFAGIITLVVSWYTSEHFGQESLDSVVKELKQALATSIASESELHSNLYQMLMNGSSSSNAALIIMLQDSDQEHKGLSFELIGQMIARRFEADLPTVLAISVPDWITEGALPRIFKSPESAVWFALAKTTKDASFRKSFSNRRSIIIPLDSPRHTLAACLNSQSDDAEPDYKGGIFAEYTRDGIIGARSNTDEEFILRVVSRFYEILDEPSSTYSKEFVDAKDALSTKLTGIPSTRSLITSQLLIAAQKALEDAPVQHGGRYIEVVSLDPSDNRRQSMLYAADMFLPPLETDANHSGSVLATYIEKGIINVRDKVTLEIGCGPGFLTRSISQHCGSGLVIATDLSPRAIEIAKKNILPQFSHSVQFLCADCLKLDFALHSEDGLTRLSVTSTDYENTSLDVVLIELPLLPYRGHRKLTLFETPYLESTPLDSSQLLPPTMEKLLRSLGGLVGQSNTEILTPICAANVSELEAVQREIQNLVGRSCSVDLIAEGTLGFLYCFSIKKNKGVVKS